MLGHRAHLKQPTYLMLVPAISHSRVLYLSCLSKSCHPFFSFFKSERYFWEIAPRTVLGSSSLILYILVPSPVLTSNVGFLCRRLKMKRRLDIQFFFFFNYRQGTEKGRNTPLLFFESQMDRFSSQLGLRIASHCTG